MTCRPISRSRSEASRRRERSICSWRSPSPLTPTCSASRQLCCPALALLARGPELRHGSARFFLRGEPFYRAVRPIGLSGSRFRMLLGAELFRFSPVIFIDAPARHLRVKHFEGAAAGVDLVVMSEIGEAFEDAEQLLVPGSTPDLEVAGAALRAERPEPCQFIAR